MQATIRARLLHCAKRSSRSPPACPRGPRDGRRFLPPELLEADVPFLPSPPASSASPITASTGMASSPSLSSGTGIPIMRSNLNRSSWSLAMGSLLRSGSTHEAMIPKCAHAQRRGEPASLGQRWPTAPSLPLLRRRAPGMTPSPRKWLEIWLFGSFCGWVPNIRPCSDGKTHRRRAAAP